MHDTKIFYETYFLIVFHRNVPRGVCGQHGVIAVCRAAAEIDYELAHVLMDSLENSGVSESTRS